MRKINVMVVAVAFISMTACKVKYGCPANGRSIGAEKLVSGDPKAMKEAKKAKKFKS